MKEEEDDLADVELIERFMEGQLTAEERAATLQRLRSDSKFALLFEDIKVITAGIQKNGRDKLVSFIKTIDVPEHHSDTNFSLGKFAWTLGSAAILILGFGIMWWNVTSERVDHEKLFSANFTPYQNVVMPEVRGEQKNRSLKAEAYALYDRGEYLQAIQTFKSLNEPDDEGVLMYLGNSYLASGSPADAIACFKKLEEKNTAWHTSVEWYLGLAYLANGNIDDARVKLQKLAEAKNSYTERAKEIIKEF